MNQNKLYQMYMSAIIPNKNDVRLVFTPQLFIGGLVSYLRYLCLFAHSGVQRILCCVVSHNTTQYALDTTTCVCGFFLLCFLIVFVLYLVCPVLPVPLDCPFFIAPFSKVY
jgi:hypothetical protein